MKNFKLFAGAAALLVLAGCQQNPSVDQPREGVRFTTSIGTFATRAADNAWHAGDEVGIYMVATGASLDANALAFNRKYVTTGTWDLLPASPDQQIFFPDNGAAVDFIAYYPWTEAIDEFIYPVNVAVQDPQAAIDLLYSNDETGRHKGDNIAEMTFTHQLSKVILNITDLTEDIAPLKVKFEGIHTTADFNLATDELTNYGGVADVEMVVTTTGQHTARAEAIILPHETKDYSLLFTIGTKALRLTVPEAAFDEAKKHVYNVTITDKVNHVGGGEIIDWGEEPGDDLGFDVKDLASAIPLVYPLERMGGEFALPPLPEPADLEPIVGLPDPFEFSDKSGRVTTVSQWERRRWEIMQEAGFYEWGMKPAKPESVTATLTGNTMRVIIEHNGQTMTLQTNLTIPAGDGPFPVAIGMGGGAPAARFPGCILMSMPNGSVCPDNQTRTSGFWLMYPELAEPGWAGNYTAWVWGTSRMIDGLEILVEQGLLKADLSKIATYGCSWAGKLSLFSGAFDERVALTFVQESGGGGINSWRISDQAVADNIAHGDSANNQEVERVNNTNYGWFGRKLQDNFMGRTDCLPYDHHELIALIAPRAVIIHGNPDYVWMADKGGYSSAVAALEVWKAMGVEDRFGYNFANNHGHCSLPASQVASGKLFVDKFLFGIDGPTESVRYAPADQYLYGRSADPIYWMDAWDGHKLTGL